MDEDEVVIRTVSLLAASILCAGRNSGAGYVIKLSTVFEHYLLGEQES